MRDETIKIIESIKRPNKLEKIVKESLIKRVHETIKSLEITPRKIEDKNE